MNLLLRPIDVLYFGDGRPVGTGLAGHGAGWPLPTYLSAALHGLLHRPPAGLMAEALQKSGKNRASGEKREFGSLVSAGPYPVAPSGAWYFSKPADVALCEECQRLEIVLEPGGTEEEWKNNSSLPQSLKYAVPNRRTPTKDTKPLDWIDRGGFEQCLTGKFEPLRAGAALAHDQIFLSEATTGIGIDGATGTQDGESIYSAQYLRMREGWRLGVRGAARRDPEKTLLDVLFPQPGSRHELVVGGQQRRCVAEAAPGVAALPRGINSFAAQADDVCRIKWVLLSPAVWPKIGAQSKDGRTMNEHPGGWLPNWIDPESGDVKLRVVPEGERQERRKSTELRRDPKCKSPGKYRYASEDDSLAIHARLVAAIVSKPIIVTGYAGGNPEEAAEGAKALSAGAKPTHLAVPAGAVYYFETKRPDLHDPADPFDPVIAAQRLAQALNWHGAAGLDAEIRNRRSTLLGEKGFGLGVCGAWSLRGDAGT